MADSFIEAHLRAAVESAPSGLLIADSDGHIVLVNREIERMFGYAREELLGRPIERLVPARFRDNHPASRAGFRNDPRVRSMGAGRDLFGLRKDGTDVPIEIGLTPLATEDGLFVLAAVVDISERRRLEMEQRTLSERLRQAQKMEAIGTLAGGIAHDFNNILTGIIGYAELLGFRFDPASTEARDANEILAAAMRGKSLVERILAFSRRQEAELRPVDLSEIVREVQQLLRATLPANIALNVRVPRAFPTVMADSTSIHQVLMNLASNAAQAMPAGGKLEFAIEHFYVRDHVARENPGLRESEYLSIYVSDSGEGMDAETRARAFEPFYTTKPAGSGTGLGLSVVHGIMQEHHGAVLIESARGTGTTVRCLFPLPLDAQRAALSREVAETALHARGERVLLVDDEPLVLESTALRLEFLGYAVTRAGHPSVALKMMRESAEAFDLVISDHSMPEMPGTELCAMIRALRSDLPIILLSGFVDNIAEDTVARSGVTMVLQKPVVMVELARACRAALGESVPPAQA